MNASPVTVLMSWCRLTTLTPVISSAFLSIHSGRRWTMQKLIQGIHQFQKDIFRPLQGLFEELAKGQNPETLFITCSDSRIDPTLLTKAQPGDLFIFRNAGNIIPPHGAGNGGDAATIEFAVV